MEYMSAWLGEGAFRQAFWMSSISEPLEQSRSRYREGDHRNDGLYSLLNDIAKRGLKDTGVQFFDVFNLTLAVNDAALDNAHYTHYILKEMVRVILTAILKNSEYSW